MSASEKLKALEGFTLNCQCGREYVIPEMHALPQIVAVVEAAQRMARADFRSGQVYPTKTDQDRLDEALAALDEALSVHSLEVA